jgi:hypothetical protein
MFARQTCFCEALRSLAIASSRWRFGRVILMEIPVRMRKTRTRTKQMESLRDSYVRQRPLASDESSRAAVISFLDFFGIFGARQAAHTDDSTSRFGFLNHPHRHVGRKPQRTRHYRSLLMVLWLTL